MRAGRPSATAVGAAAFRAGHLHLFDGPPIHADSFALALAGIDGPAALRARFARSEPPGLRRVCAYFSLRHRFSEERLASAVARGVAQVVLLGAGLDSFALRHPEIPKQVRFVEIDHPDSQRWKLERLDALGLSTAGVHYVPVDFASQDLAAELVAAGVDPAQPAFFAWLGVTQYIAASAALQTISLVSRHAVGSEIVFDVILPLAAEEHAISSFAEAGSQRHGEAWVSYFRPEQLARDLLALGFRRVDTLSPGLAAAYYAGQPPEVTPLRAWQLMAAAV